MARLMKSRLVCTLAAGIFFFGCAGHSRQAPSSDAALLAGMGSVHHPIATQNAEAQRFFDQGLALVYGFNFAEAVKSFSQAAHLDPKTPMPYWGMALANGPNYNAWTMGPARREAALDAIRSALRLSANSPQPEQVYVKALAQCYPAIPPADPAQPLRDCAHALREVYQAYPDDADAAVLYAASLMTLSRRSTDAPNLWTLEGKPGADTVEIVSVLEEVLRRWPDHIGANHFYIHAMEASPYPERALPSAHRLETLAPAAGHLVHMPSHIYLRTGAYSEAVKANQRAVEADERYLKEQPDGPGGGMSYFDHNFHYLAVAANMDGEYQVAVDAARRLQTHAHSAALIAMPMVVLLRFARWDELLALPEPHTEFAGVGFFWRYARGFAYASKGKVDEALHERTAMEEEFAKLPPGRAFAVFFNDWNVVHSIAADALDARIAAARGDAGSAFKLWQAAAAVQDQMNFDEVPDWYYPVRESWGAALLRNGRFPQAEDVFREDLRRNPRNPRSLFGLGKALEGQNKSYEASWIHAAFAAAWKGEAPPRIEEF